MSYRGLPPRPPGLPPKPSGPPHTLPGPPLPADRKRSRSPSLSSTEKRQRMEAQTAPNHSHTSQAIRIKINDPGNYVHRATTISKPQEVAHYSHDENHGYVADDSAIRYYWPPKIGASLVEGFETWRHYEDEEDPHLEYLLKTIVSKEKSTGEKIEADFVCFRGMMTNILTLPFSRFAECDLLATFHDGTIFMQENFQRKLDRNADKGGRPNYSQGLTPEQMMYGGYKFETLSLVDKLPSQGETFTDNRSSEIVSNYAQHCSIVKTAVGSSKLILAGEVDGLSEPKTEGSTDSPWVELKTTLALPKVKGRSDHKETTKFERKLLKFWAQSYLLGVPKIIVGFRNEFGVLVGLQEFETLRIPGMVQREQRTWNSADCVRFADTLLEKLKHIITGEGVWAIKRLNGSNFIDIKKVEETGTGGILSQEFLDWRASLTEKEELEEKTNLLAE